MGKISKWIKKGQFYGKNQISRFLPSKLEGFIPDSQGSTDIIIKLMDLLPFNTLIASVHWSYISCVSAIKSNVDCWSVTMEKASSFFDAFESFDLKYKKVGTILKT